MAEEGEEKTYTLITKPFSGDSETLTSSHKYDGQGTANYINGDVYTGTFVQGRRTGKGKYAFVNGDAYEGHYQENRKHGLGKMTFAGNGTGEEESTRGGVYHGQFHNRLRHGQGAFTYLNGDVYRGSWADGQKHGQGTYEYVQDGGKLIGEWKKNSMISGRWVLKNGAYFVGVFKNNKPSGKGVWVLPNGTQAVGNFTQTVTYAGEGGEEADGEPPDVQISFSSLEATAVN